MCWIAESIVNVIDLPFKGDVVAAGSVETSYIISPSGVFSKSTFCSTCSRISLAVSSTPAATSASGL